MSVTRRSGVIAAAAATVLFAAQLVAAPAYAEPDVEPAQPEVTEPAPGLLHNVTYRARADGTSRGAVVAYKADDQNVNSEQPTMLPGQTFEVNTVLSDPNLAGMELSIQWPYGSNLHCEILVDDQVVAQADQFIAPRLFRAKDDPLYGVMKCGAPLDNPASGLPAPVPEAGMPDYPPQPASEAVPAE
ncbi:hypothetical protein H7J08_07365 [Mycobacterium frederiksbergense]|uniref:hypothetical protein n=1 Tax=Mycolicibacterium frederiksbergense TaxID=117567 RepID=UPI0021F278B0|nr:hypothetical protein [Mycolicibacterium frederiksbergense]MCV7044490.1 hypothetical protein [Mycolicibacterium frederiksbergense]